MFRFLSAAAALALPALAQASPYIDFRLADGGADPVNGAYVRTLGTSGLMAWNTIGCTVTTLTERTGNDKTVETQPIGSATYSMTGGSSVWELGCHSSEGITTKTVVIQPNAAAAPPPHPSTGASFTGTTSNLLAPLAFLGLGIASDKLSWTFPHANICTGSGAWSGTKQVSGSQTNYRVTQARTYTMTCINAAGSVVKSVTLR